MPSEYDVRQARSEGRAEGVRAELQRLRAFTGIDGLAAPDHSLPEHEAYPMYEQSLLERMEREQQRGGWRQEGLPEAKARAAEADADYEDALRNHQEDRQSAGIFGKISSLITQPFLPEKRMAQEAHAYADELRAEVIDLEQKLDVLRTEHEAVGQWLDHMYATTAEAGEKRLADQEAAQRDISNRNFQVFEMHDYLEQDNRRKLRWEGAPEVPGGADFGYHWRRDGDDTGERKRNQGTWHAVWISENQEAAIFRRSPGLPDIVILLGDHIRSMDEAMDFFVPLESRQSERNSIALLMDAYTEKYL